MERQSSPIPLCPLPCHKFPVVGITSGIHLRQPANDALSWLWLLRFLLYNTNYWQSPCRYTVFLYTV